MHDNCVVWLTGAATRQWLDFCLSSQHTESMSAEALSRPCSAWMKATKLMSEVKLN